MVSATLAPRVQPTGDDDDIDRLVPLTKVKFPGNPHSVTRWRWRNRGISRGDRRIFLKTTTCGARVFCCQRWADEFIAACNSDNPATPPADNFAKRAKSENAALKAALG